MIILDHTAALALCHGHRPLSGLAVKVDDPDQRPYIPALCLVVASRPSRARS